MTAAAKARALANDGKIEIKISHWPDGSIKSRIELLNGKFYGTSEGWYQGPDIKKRWKRHWKDDRQHGTFEDWNSDGVLISRKTYDRDVLQGLLEEWYCDGRPKKFCMFVDGNQHGVHMLFRPNGEIYTKTYFRHGVYLYAHEYRANLRVLGAELAEAAKLSEKSLGTIIAQYCDLPPDFPNSEYDSSESKPSSR